MPMTYLPRLCLYLSCFILLLGIGLACYGITYHDDIMGAVGEMPPHFSLGVNLIIVGIIGTISGGLMIKLAKRKQATQT